MNHNLRFSYSKELLTKSTNNRIDGVRKSAKLLQSAFDKFENDLKVGLNVEEFKREFVYYLTMNGASLTTKDIAFCRFGELHATVEDNNPLEAGEAFTLDAWLSYDGWYADMARPYVLDPVASKFKKLRNCAKACNEKAMEIAEVGLSFIEIVEEVQKVALTYKCHIVKEAFGHGIGRELHEEPEVPFSYKGRNLFDKIKNGDVMTFEPVLSLKEGVLVEALFGKYKLNNSSDLLFSESIVAFENDKKIILCR